MTTALVITLREGIEAALVLGIILTYLRRTGHTSLNRYVYWGLGLGVAVSLVLGIVFQMVGFDTETLEGPALAVGGIFVASMVVWMWHTSKSIKHHMETKMGNIVAEGKSSQSAAIGFLAFTFFMVGREGIETVLFLTAATLGKTSILDLIGGMLGVALAFLFAVFFIRGSLKVNLSRFFAVTSIVLLVLAAKLLGGSVHEFAERGVIPMSASVMQWLGYFVRDRDVSLFLTGLIIIPILVVLWDFRRANGVSAPSEGSAAEQRKWRATQRSGKTIQLSLVGTTLVIALAMVSQTFAASPFIDPSPQPVSAVSGQEIRLATDSWEPSALQKFSYPVSGTEVRFLAVKLPDGNVATSLDACHICGAEGYMLDKKEGVVICKLCQAPIVIATIGQGGGCNPLPLSSRTEGTTLIVPVSDLEKQAQRFQRKGE